MEKGEELLIDYGIIGNQQSFLHYGFLSEPSRDDQYIMTLGLDPSHPLGEMKMQIVADNHH